MGDRVFAVREDLLENQANKDESEGTALKGDKVEKEPPAYRGSLVNRVQEDQMELKETVVLRVYLAPWVKREYKAVREIPVMLEIKGHLASQVRREALAQRVTWERWVHWVLQAIEATKDERVSLDCLVPSVSQEIEVAQAILGLEEPLGPKGTRDEKE